MQPNNPGESSSRESGEERKEPLTIDEIAELQEQKEHDAEEKLIPAEEREASEARAAGASPEAEPAADVEKEVAKEREPAEETSGEGPGGKQDPAASNLPKNLQVDAFLKEFLASDHPQQIKTLVVIAFKKGVHHAVDLAKASKNAYLLDTFHDALVDELRDHFVKKNGQGII